MDRRIEEGSAVSSVSANAIAQLCISTYLDLPKLFHPAPRSNGTPQWCILAGIVLIQPGAISSTGSPSRNPDLMKCISLGTGTKCLPESKLPPNGDILHDSHAEVLARRGAIRWLYEEILRWTKNGERSDWVERGEKDEGELFRLKPGIQAHMYVSTLPCGDASTLLLSLAQDPAMAELKESSRATSLSSATDVKALVGRGRDDYSALGMLRTKPGRADSPPTISMSCSDKIASWTLLGLQGALLAQFMNPVYLDSLIFGDVEESLRPTVLEECKRAFVTRLRPDSELPRPFRRYEPQIAFTSVAFPYSRSQAENNPKTGAPPLSESESKSWIADSSLPAEVLVDGRKRGSSLKAKSTAFRSRISKAALFDLHLELKAGLVSGYSEDGTYFDVKQETSRYQDAKTQLRKDGGPLAGWIVSGPRWEAFTSAIYGQQGVS
ncbi:hypothetical protein FRB90_005468 [Tulasnella sp. 427]|nr:hypothetical protein FRB90_005468 [Tulasnella sp. 427]